ncbi:MAG TPA: MMPL family transporter [Candidatus Polarisedimenticolia bacterium]|jgi:hypothetical protein
MIGSAPPGLQRVFRAVVALRWWFVALYALLLPLGIYLALHVAADNSIGRLVVADDPDFQSNEAFQRIFPEGQQAVLLAVADDPFSPGAVAKVEQIGRLLSQVPRVTVFSSLDLYERARGRPAAADGSTEDFRRFATGTSLFRKQGLVGSDFLGIAVELKVSDSLERDETLAAIDRALADVEAAPAPLTRIRRVGGPYVDAYLEAETGRASMMYLPLFGLFVIVVNLALYRSFRTLAAFLVTLGVCASLTVGFARLVGFSFTIVSSLVPLTILVTTTAALVYIQSRFAEHPGEGTVDEHQIFTLANKFVATTASIFAAAIGFAALAVSGIRPIHDMGLWVAAGLVMTWVVVFTLFPALQRILATPVLRRRTASGRVLLRAFHALPLVTYRWRWFILVASLLLMIVGALSLTGLPGVVEPMSLETDSLAYIDRTLPLYEDTRHFEEAISGLSAIQVWVSTPDAGILQPELLRGMEEFAREMEADSRVGSVAGPTSLLRWTSYATGQGDRLPREPAAWEGLAAQLDQILLEEPAARAFVDVGSMANARLTVIHRGKDFKTVEEIKQFIGSCWERAAARVPALAAARMRVVGSGLLQAKIAEYLVPTLTESFALTAAIIFVAFLIVFRSGAARLMAMIPSVFAILVMFFVMRLIGIPLNIATILIASTVLGTSENDQIHFFFHFQERRDGGSTEQALRHALMIAGRGILFATLINAGGFLALALSGLPPMRQFGIISASAFALSMLASLTALPAALWIFSREGPDER